MILLADSGSTKTSWCLKKKGSEDFYFNTPGYNPYYLDSVFIAASMSSSIPTDIDLKAITEVNFYGAGCTDEKSGIVKDAIQSVFPNAKTQIHIDLLAAARAVLGNNAGFVGILGTGTNSCFYDGEHITHIVNSLGFMIGDEGSGGYLGKKLIISLIRGFMPDNLKTSFYESYKLTDDDILNEIYASKMPNTYCASFCPFISEHIDHPFIIDLVKGSFRDFFQNIVSLYPNYKNYSFNCVGSVAHNFLPLLTEVADEFHMKVGNIIRNPLDGLTNYHLIS